MSTSRGRDHLRGRGRESLPCWVSNYLKPKCFVKVLSYKLRWNLSNSSEGTDSLCKALHLGLCQAESRGFSLLVQEAWGDFSAMFPAYHLIAQWCRQMHTDRCKKKASILLHSCNGKEYRKRARSCSLNTTCSEGAISFKKRHSCIGSELCNSATQTGITLLKARLCTTHHPLITKSASCTASPGQCCQHQRSTFPQSTPRNTLRSSPSAFPSSEHLRCWSKGGFKDKSDCFVSFCCLQ